MAGLNDNPTIHNKGTDRMNNAIKGFMVIGLLAMLEAAYAVRPTIITGPDGKTIVCYVYPNGTVFCDAL
jgi:hypothetical protein